MDIAGNCPDRFRYKMSVRGEKHVRVSEGQPGIALPIKGVFFLSYDGFFLVPQQQTKAVYKPFGKLVIVMGLLSTMLLFSTLIFALLSGQALSQSVVKSNNLTNAVQWFVFFFNLVMI